MGLYESLASHCLYLFCNFVLVPVESLTCVFSCNLQLGLFHKLEYVGNMLLCVHVTPPRERAATMPVWS